MIGSIVFFSLLQHVGGDDQRKDRSLLGLEGEGPELQGLADGRGRQEPTPEHTKKLKLKRKIGFFGQRGRCGRKGLKFSLQEERKKFVHLHEKTKNCITVDSND